MFEWRSHFALQRGGAAEPDEFASEWRGQSSEFVIVGKDQTSEFVCVVTSYHSHKVKLGYIVKKKKKHFNMKTKMCFFFLVFV